DPDVVSDALRSSVVSRNAIHAASHHRRIQKKRANSIAYASTEPCHATFTRTVAVSWPRCTASVRGWVVKPCYDECIGGISRVAPLVSPPGFGDHTPHAAGQDRPAPLRALLSKGAAS